LPTKVRPPSGQSEFAPYIDAIGWATPQVPSDSENQFVQRERNHHDQIPGDYPDLWRNFRVAQVRFVSIETL